MAASVSTTIEAATRALPGETERYIRFAYSGINLDQMEEGLTRLKAFVEKA